MPIAHVDRIFRITVCLSPFPAAGTRLDVERVGDKAVMHKRFPQIAQRNHGWPERTSQRVPIVAMTAHAMNGDRDKCLAAGMDAYVPKPIRSSDLIEIMNKLLADRKFGMIRTVPSSGDNGSERTRELLRRTTLRPQAGP
jgi:hypothetical protein